MIKFHAVVSVTSDGYMGINNDLIYRSPMDMALFRYLTVGKTVLMGGNTAKSLPSKLPDRHTIAVSNSLPDNFDKVDKVIRRSRCGIPSVELEARKWYLDKYESAFLDQQDVYIIGGSVLIESFLSIIDEFHITIFDRPAPKISGGHYVTAEFMDVLTDEDFDIFHVPLGRDKNVVSLHEKNAIIPVGMKMLRAIRK